VRIVWERTFGLGRVAAVATFADKIIVAAFDPDEKNVDPEGIAAWRFNSAGEPYDRCIYGSWLVLIHQNMLQDIYAILLTYSREEVVMLGE
jgi:hypothetical protein